MSRGNWFSILLVAVVAVMAGGCGGCGSSGKKGPFVAEGKGVAVTSEEFKTKLDEQSRFSRPRLNTMEGKKEVLDNMVSFELMVREARSQKLDQDPEVQQAIDKIIVQKLVRKSLDENGAPATAVSDDDAKNFYDQHIDEFVKPERLGLAQMFFKSADAAKAAYTRIKAEEQRDPMVFPTLARQLSEDEATKPMGGDLGYKSRAEFEKQFGPAAADAAFALKNIGEETQVVQSAKGFHIFRLTSKLPAFNASFDQAKPQIVARIGREKRSKEFQDWVKKLRDEAGVKVDEAELEKINVPVAPPPGIPQVIGGAPPPGQPIVLPGPPGGPSPAPAAQR